MRPCPPEAEAAYRAGASDVEIGERFGANWRTAARWRRALGIPVYDKWAQRRASHTLRQRDVLADRETAQGPRGDSDAEWDRYLSRVADLAESKADLDTEEPHLQRDWGDKPVALFATGDWHWGGAHTAARRLLDDMAYVGAYQKRHPGALRPMHLGDAIEGYVPKIGKAAGGMAEAVEPDAKMQEKGIRRVMAQLDWDGIYRGCHEDFLMPERDVIAERAELFGAANCGYGAVWDVAVGRQMYRLNLRHKWKSESGLNTTNAQRRMDDDFPLPAEVDGPALRADAHVLGHLHNGDFQQRGKGGRMVTFARVGSYKGGDCYTRKGGYTLYGHRPDAGHVVLILDPQQHNIIGMHPRHWKLALDLLAHLRGEREK